MRQEAVSLFLCYLLLCACCRVEAGKGPRTWEGCGMKKPTEFQSPAESLRILGSQTRRAIAMASSGSL